MLEGLVYMSNRLVMADGKRPLMVWFRYEVSSFSVPLLHELFLEN
jgi:hypothetical protein